MRSLKDERILHILRCPVCSATMRVSDNGASLLCGGAKTHCYDFSASGYVNLCAPTQSGGGDSKVAVRARTQFLDRDYYRPVAEAVERAVMRFAPKDKPVIDAGCGEGYYSMFPARRGYGVFGADLSKFAVDAAAKRAARESLENAFFSTTSVFDLPVADCSAGAIVNIFAPCAEGEFSRALCDDGVLIVAYAGERHLLGLKAAIYRDAHVNTERADMPSSMSKVYEERVSYNIDVNSNEDIMSLFAMTPYYWRTSQSDAEKLRELDSLNTDVDIIVAVFRKKQNT